MNKRFRLSPGAPSLVLIVVVLSMSIMGMLMFIRTQNDQRLSDRSLLVAKADALLMEKAEARYADLDNLTAICKNNTDNDAAFLKAVKSALPDGTEMEGRRISWQEDDQGRVLYAAVELAPYEENERLLWHTRTLYAEVGNTWNEF